MTNKYRVKVGEIEFYLEGDSDYIERERSFFLGNILPQAVGAIAQFQVSSPPLLLDEPTSTHAENNGKQGARIAEQSVNEFLNEKLFGSQLDTALGLIYFWQINRSEQSSSSEDLKTYFQNAKEKAPVNPSDVIQKLVQRGHIQATVEESRRYAITRSGISYIESYTPKVKKDAKITTKTRRLSTKSSSSYYGLTREELNLDKYPPSNVVKDFKDKMMLAMYIVTAEEKGVSFTANDVHVVLSNIFNEKASPNQINGVFNRYPRWFNETTDSDNKKSVKRSLLNDGIIYCEEMIAAAEDSK